MLKKPSGRLIFTFHHWRAEAWARLTLALKDADFRLNNFFVIYSENPISVHIRQLNALKHDAVLLLQPAVYPKEDRHDEPIQQIDRTDSANFCRDCAKVLGFCLEAKLSDTEIFALWQEILGN